MLRGLLGYTGRGMEQAQRKTASQGSGPAGSGREGQKGEEGVSGIVWLP